MMKVMRLLSINWLYNIMRQTTDESTDEVQEDPRKRFIY